MADRAAPFPRRLSAANADFLFAPGRFTLLISLLFAALFIFKSALFPGMGGDDGEQLIFAQYFDWGYDVRNPPLYTWLVIAAQEAFGASAWAVNAVKFALLWLLYWFLYRAGLEVFDDRRLAVLAALSPLLIFHIAWDSLIGFSHSILAAVLYAAAVYAVLRLDKTDHPLAYAGLGAAMGFGILSKYAFVFFIVALLAACLCDHRLRKRVLNPRILITLLIAAAVTAPHLHWLYARHAEMAQEIAPALSASGLGPHLLAAGKGVLSTIKAIVGFLLPLIVFLAIFFTPAWKRLPASNPAESDTQRFHRFFIILFAVLIGLMVAFIAIGGISRVRTHYMFALILVPLFFFLRVRLSDFGEARLRRYAAATSLAALIVFFGLPVKYAAEPFTCGKCEHHLPYAAFADQIEKAGFRTGTILAYWHPYPIAGNLRAAFPKARVISAKHPDIVPPPGATPGQCLLIWSGPPASPGAGATIALANKHFGTDFDPSTPGTALSARLSTGTHRTYRLSYILAAEGRGQCR
ncbi:MAG: glycosyltransferase family 39 protein [Rhodospirillales bacterium]